MECYGYAVNFPLDSDDDDDDDYDDTPLFTREPSYRAFKRDSTKIYITSPKNVITNDEKKSEEDVSNELGQVWYVIYKTTRGSIHVKEARRRSLISDNLHRLSYFQSNLFATVLEDVLTQLHLLDKCNNELRLLKIQTDMTDLLGAKFEVKPSTINDEIDNIDVKEVENEHYKLIKLIDDRRLCDAVMKETYLDLSLNQRYFHLVKHRRNVTSRLQHNETLTEETSRNKIFRRDLMKNLRHQRNRMKSSVYETNAYVSELINRIEDSSLHREVRHRYIDRWQGARSEQHTFQIQCKEAGPSGAIAHYRRKCEEEQRVHLEVETLTNIQLDETLSLIENIMTKYDKDIEAIDLKIQNMRKKFEDQTETRLEMEQKLADHEKEIMAWVEFKEEREKVRLYRLKMTNAAIAVQAWWRGLLVRLELGPYNPKKKRTARPPPPPDKKKKK